MIMHLVLIFLLAGPLVFVHTTPTFNYLPPPINGIWNVASVPQGEHDSGTATPNMPAPAGVPAPFPDSVPAVIPYNAPVSLDLSMASADELKPNYLPITGETGSTPNYLPPGQVNTNPLTTTEETGLTLDYGSNYLSLSTPAASLNLKEYKCPVFTDIIMCCANYNSEEWWNCGFCM